jgi:hypothetical protein
MAVTPLRSVALNIDASQSTSGPQSTRNNYSPTRIASQQSIKCSLELEKVLGNTISNSKGFDSISNSIFAICSGSTAIVNVVDEHLNIKQRAFRAVTRSPAETSSSYDSPTSSPSYGRSRAKQSSRPSILGSITGSILPSETKDSPSKRVVHNKPKGLSCLALSPNGKLLAVGETGYSPRILIFSMTSGNDGPLCIVSEHVSGVQCLAFSPDSRWLCSVGDIYDGCIYLWSVAPRGTLKLYASSKCTSSVCDITWIGLDSIVTVGVRHVKVWRPDFPTPPSPTKSTYPPRVRIRQDGSAPSSPILKGLPGRNALLGSLLDATFTAVRPVTDSRAIVASDTGDLCIIRAVPGTQRLESIVNLGHPINCMNVSKQNYLWVACNNGKLWKYKTEEFSTNMETKPLASIPHLDIQCSPLALTIIQDKILCTDSSRNFNFYEAESASMGLAKSLPYHCSAALGVNIMVENSEPIGFITFDAKGQIMIWNLDGTLKQVREVHLEAAPLPLPGFEIEPNELRVVRHTSNQGLAVIGDKYGLLR